MSLMYPWGKHWKGGILILCVVVLIGWGGYDLVEWISHLRWD